MGNGQYERLLLNAIEHNVRRWIEAPTICLCLRKNDFPGRIMVACRSRCDDCLCASQGLGAE